MMNEAIVVDNITKIYGTQRALSNVSFSIGKGEIVGFLGPNGAGKSTMMKILTTYIKSTSGKAFVHGHSVDSEERKVKKMVGYLPEHNPLYLDMYITEYLKFVADLYKVPKSRDRVWEMVEKVGLMPEVHKKIKDISKGYRQRVGLAQAMIHDPEILILDEPTSGLDPNQLVEIRNLIKEVGKEKTVMLSTHIMQEVEAMCSRVIIINKGELVADNPVREIISDKKRKELEVEFSDKVSLSALKKIAGVLQVDKKSDTTFVIACDEDFDVRPAVFQFAVDHKVMILTQQYVQATLEDAFKKLTK